MATNTVKANTTEAPRSSYTGPLAIIATLFFLFGSLTSLNDVLVPYAQNVFKLRLAASMLIQTAFFSAYFVFSVPAAKLINAIGYRKAIIVALLIMVLACLAFYPAAKIPSFPFFLTALIILATGITALQVAANPYVSVLGDPRTASSRLNLTQAFNSLGTTIFPWIGAHLILGAAAASAVQSSESQGNAVVRLYCYFFSVVLFLIAIAIGWSKLPEITSAGHHIGEKVNDSLWKHPNLIFGAVGIFVYVGAEVAIGSSIANYLALDNIGGFLSPNQIPDAAARYHAALSLAARYISLYWLGAMVGRFAGSAILQKVKTTKALAFCGTVAALLVALSVTTNGHLAMWSILSVGLFNSIMFPAIFTLGIAELGPLTGDASGIMSMAIVGGAIIPWLVGQTADFINRTFYPSMIRGETSWGQGIHYALIIDTICYLYIVFFALRGSKPNSERYKSAREM